VAKKKHAQNSIYWRNKADKEVSKYYKGQPCAVCGTTYQTCGHHIVERSLSAYLRHHILNLIALCPNHHKFSNDLAAHSKNPLAVKAWAAWLEANWPTSYELLEVYKHFRGEKVDYEYNYNSWKEMNENPETQP